MRKYIAHWGWVVAILLLAAVVYTPGLHGDFLFDDYANLTSLGAMGVIDSWSHFWLYLTSGTADPTGRPLTLLTFLLDAQNWPADPLPFKRTNLALHLLNGALLYALLVRLGAMLVVNPERSRRAALLGTALWLVHPLLVSTTLYIVQREAMLPATCVLAGLLTWLHGREQLLKGHFVAGALWTVAGVVGFTLLGVLAKANGILLPMFVLLIEWVIVAQMQPMTGSVSKKIHRKLLVILAVIPSVVVVTYLVLTGVRGIITGDMGMRPWTIGQRLLTEPRILLDYLSLLWLPRPFSNGLFNDQYAASTGLLQPLSTLPALLAVAMLVSCAWLVRHRHPALALAVLFFFAGQLLESTSLPLELYFEHRNYLPAMLMFWPLGLWLGNLGTHRVLKCGLMIVLPLGLATMTYARSTVWGNVQTQALVWAQINPHSARAQANAAQIEMQSGRPLDALRRLQTALASKPNDVQLTFNLIGARCLTGGVMPSDIALAREAMQRTLNPGSLFAHWFDRTIPVAMSGDCPGLTPAVLLDLIDAGLKNPRLAGPGLQQDLVYLRGRIALARHQPNAALAEFTRALDLQIRPGMALEAASLLGSEGYPAAGLQLLDHYQQVQSGAMPPDFGMQMLHEWVLTRQNYWPHELAHLRHQLSLDVASDAARPPRPVTEPSDAR